MPKPYVPPAQPGNVGKEGPGTEVRGGILVVDDQPDLVRGMARILRTKGFRVLEAVGGRQAVEVAREHSPRVALLDIMMPDLNGIEASREIKLAVPEAVIIFMTGYSDMESQAREEGALAVLRKPLDYAKLFETLRSLGLSGERGEG